MNKEILEITKKFHDTYEKLASEYTYETREDTKVFDINSSNGKLMYATVNEIVSPILKENQELKLELSGYRQAILNNKEMLGLKEQNDKLKKKYENAVADYETTMFEKEQLNSLVNSCQEEIRQLKKQLEELKSTNKVLSEELTKDKILKQDCLTTCCGIPIGDIPKLITQQKEFIAWLEAMSIMYENEYKDIDTANHYNCALQKYKSIIGGASNE